MTKARASRPLSPPAAGTAALSEKGFALVTVLMIVTILVAAVVASSRATRTELQEAANLGDGIKLYYLAKSGVNGAQAILALDKNNYDSLAESWAKADEFAAKASLLFGSGALTLVIEDEMGKIPLQRFYEGNKVNEPIRDMLLRLLKRPEFRLAGGQAEEIVACLKDWLDPDDEVTSGGAESPYYRALVSPYEAKNGPLDAVEELLLIKGITRELFWGTAKSPGLKKFLTIWGDGKININTAPREVIAVFGDGVTEEMVEKLDLYRRDEKNDLSRPDWYKPIVGDGFDQHGLLTVKSSSFMAIAQASRDRMTKTIEAVMKRDGEKLQLISWKVD